MTDDIVQANKYKLFAVGALGTFMATLDGSIVNVALPTIATSLGASVDLVSWVVLSYSMTMIALMLVYGAWVQRKGYSFGYRYGYILFITGSLMCALSNDIYFLIASRVIQASGTAMFAAIGPGMVTTVFPPNERGKGIGLMVMMVSAGFMAGPTLGGLMLGIWPWHSIFLINIPIGLVGMVLVIRYFKLLKPKGEDKKVPIYGAAALSTSLVSAILAVKLVNQWSISDPRIWGLGVLAIVSLAVAFKFESSKATAMLGLDIFKNHRFTGAIAAQQAHFIGLSGVLVLVPFYLERVKGMVPQQVGLFLVILPILMFLLAPLMGSLSDKIGYRIPTTFGMLAVSLGLFLISGFDVQSSSGYIVLSLIVLGVGVGSFSTPNSSALMGSVNEGQRSVTSSVLATNRNIGMSVGVALSTALFSFFETQNHHLADERLIFVSGFKPVIFVSMGFALLGVLLCITRAKQGGNKLIDSFR